MGPTGIRVALLLILVTVALAARHKYHADLASGRERLSAIPSQVYHSRVGDIEYYLTGDGPTVLISHGITGGVDQGLGLARTAFGEGYRFLAVSRFGYLKSTMPMQPSARLQAEAYAELLDHLDIDAAYVFGNSAGATAAYHFAIDYPGRTKGLILLSANVPGDNRGLPPQSAVRAVFGSELLYWSTVRMANGALLGMFVPRPILRAMTASERRTLIADVLLSGLPMAQRTSGVLFDMFTSNPAVNDGVNFAAITSPTLILHAVDDPAPPIAGARLVASLIPDVTLVSFRDGGHLLIGHDEEVRRAIHDFAAPHEAA